jgi:NAD(P)-dependent dehydrogenase (short-subunit alcohol dehydrogenase family)
MKNILLTGATSGIGLSVCSALLEQGDRVFAIGRNIDAFLTLANVYSDNRLVVNCFDLGNLDGIEDLISGFCELYGRLDGMVLCAGVEETMPLSLYKIDKVQAIFNINVFSNIEILRVFSKKKNSSDGSSVVFLSSVMSELGQSGKVGYCATKSAILGLVKSAALELSNRKIKVNAVAPAIVQTPMTVKLFDNLSSDQIQIIKDMHPNGFGETSDIVPMILFLLSKGAGWITGQNIKIDGGYSIK